MGDAADEAWDAAFDRDADLWFLVRSIEDNCETKQCRIVSADYEDDDDWLPYRCATCGARFDFP